jgi:hypothetical protein
MRSEAVSPCGQHQDPGGPPLPANPGDDVDPGKARHPPVQDRQVVLVEPQLFDRVITALDAVHLVPGVLEPLDQHLPKAPVVLGDENSHGSGPRGPLDSVGQPLQGSIVPAATFRSGYDVQQDEVSQCERSE